MAGRDPIGRRTTPSRSPADAVNVLRGLIGSRVDAEPEHYQEALDRFRRAGDGFGQAWSINNGLGEAALLAGCLADAQAHHTEALTVAAETGSRHQLACAHTGLGHVHRDRAEVDQARTHYELAHATYVELDMPEAGQVQAELSRLGPAGDGRSDAPDDR